MSAPGTSITTLPAPASRLWNKPAVFALVLLLAGWADAPATAGRRALDLLLAHNFDAFSQLLTVAAKEKMTLEFLRQRAGTELEGFGKLEEVGKPVTATSGGDTMVSFPCRFERVTVNIQLTVSAAGKIAGLYFRPSDAPLPPVWTRPVYSKPELFREREITLGKGEWKLPGALTLPFGKLPVAAVVLVHGPGPNDRDESIYSNRMFKDIAEGLASRGVAVLRYDKRTKVYGEKMSQGPYTLREETVDDAVTALAFLRQQTGVDSKRIFVLGHSLGGYAIPRIAARATGLAGAVFLAANARAIEDVVLEQNERLSIAQRADQASQRRLEALRAEVAKVKQLRRGAMNPPVVLGLPSAYLLDLQGYDASAQAKLMAMPMLFLQGERDSQVGMTDFGLWKSALAGRRDAAFDSFAPLNHLFIAGEDTRVPGNVSAAVIERIAGWMKQN